jgi:hypothetical protein
MSSIERPAAVALVAVTRVPARAMSTSAKPYSRSVCLLTISMTSNRSVRNVGVECRQLVIEFVAQFGDEHVGVGRLAQRRIVFGSFGLEIGG